MYRATRYTLSVGWPWAEVDPASRYKWNGRMGFDIDDWHLTLFRVEPDPTTLRAGDRCRVGIPPTLVHVLQVRAWYFDRDTGSLPREGGVGLTLLPQGVAHDLGNLDEASYINPFGPEPVRVELLRPYAFLEDLDVVADREGSSLGVRPAVLVGGTGSRRPA